MLVGKSTLQEDFSQIRKNPLVQVSPGENLSVYRENLRKRGKLHVLEKKIQMQKHLDLRTAWAQKFYLLLFSAEKIADFSETRA